MFARDCFKVAGLICLVLPFTGCTNTQVASIAVTPATQSLTIGQTVQYTATGTVGHGSHPATSTNLTGEVTWSSSSPDVASVTASGGMATALAAGSTVISATMAGVTTATATLTVTAATSGGSGGSGGSGTGGTGGTGGSTGTTLASLAVIPGSQSVAVPQDTTQFFAIGTTTSGATEDLTSQVTWYSSSAQVASITSNGGLATAAGQGTTTITAIASNGSGNSVVAGTATLTVTAGTAEQITALSLIPTSVSVSASNGQSQLIALGTQGSTGLDEDVTSANSISWQSSSPTIATVDPTSGLVTGVSPGSATITAEYTNNAGTTSANVVAASVNVTVTLTAAPEPLLSLSIIPSSITVGNLEDTGNFLAIGTFSDVPYVRDLTNTVTWLSSAPQVFPVSTNSSATNPGAPGGIATAYGNGSATIIAEATSSDGTIQTATATFNCPLALPNPNGVPPTPGTCYPGSESSGLLVTLTVYNEGLNTTNWLVTGPSATNTPNVIHCGPGWAADGNAGGSVCTATYPLGTTITLTAPAQSGVNFGGWSYNCTPILAVNAAGPNSCQITLGNSATSNNGVATSTGNSNVTVGAIFN
jgi:Bacterial Ig-like domain (group 2)